jgi:hypothetical protein
VQYLDLLDDLHKNTDPDPEEVWKPVAILDHSLQTHIKDDVHIKVKVLWLNGEETWVRVNALLVNELIILTEYARKNRLQSQLHSQWFIRPKRYGVNNQPISYHGLPRPIRIM